MKIIETPCLTCGLMSTPTVYGWVHVDHLNHGHQASVQESSSTEWIEEDELDTQELFNRLVEKEVK